MSYCWLCHFENVKHETAAEPSCWSGRRASGSVGSFMPSTRRHPARALNGISDMQKKLTGWLILLIIILGPLQFGGAARSLNSVSDSFRPYLADYPSLS